MPSAQVWDEFETLIRSGLQDLTRNTVGDVLDQARADTTSFVTRSETSLRRWVDALAQGMITQDDFEDLVKGQSQLATLSALTSLGLAKIKLERFRAGLINLVVQSALKVVPI